MDNGEKKTTLKIINFRHPVTEKPIDLDVLLAEHFGITKENIKSVSILRRSIDSRQARIDFVYTLSAVIEVDESVLNKILLRKDVMLYNKKEFIQPAGLSALKSRPVIAGCGPAGLFAAITLVERGIKPILFERGERISHRIVTVDNFWKKGELKPDSNTCFGEGGAGTFSDGKLTTRIKSPLKEKVLKVLVEAGAEEDILYISKPHLGTDRLRKIIPCIVEQLKHNGVEFFFNTSVSEIKIEQGCISGVFAGKEFIKTDNFFLAAGHSARDIFSLLNNKGINLEPKGFAVGMRIEHPQEYIDKIRLKKQAVKQEYARADYFISYKDKASSRGVYTFCMCPGGFVIGCSSSYGELCVNGMSTYARNSPWANSAVVVTVGADDLSGKSVLKGIEFQQQLEKNAFRIGGGNYFAPVQRALEFISKEKKQIHYDSVRCSYRPGTVYSDLRSLLPEFLYQPLLRGLKHFDLKMPGFIEEGILIGVETRTSSPVRIIRDNKNFHTPGLRGLIPIGEGSGYAGGIVSSAVDGIRAAMQFDL
jgi:hypothetical protein